MNGLCTRCEYEVSRSDAQYAVIRNLHTHMHLLMNNLQTGQEDMKKCMKSIEKAPIKVKS